MITDFNASGEILDFRSWNSSFAAWDSNGDSLLNAADAIASNVGGHLVLNFGGGDALTLQGVTALDATDFWF